MPFTGSITMSGFGGRIVQVIINAMDRSMKKTIPAAIKKSMKDFGPLLDEQLSKPISKFKKALAKKDTWIAVGQAFKYAASIPLGLFDGMAGMFQLLGVFEPILAMINGLLSIFSGSILQEMAPALAELAETFFSAENIQLIEKVGSSLGRALVPVLGVFGNVLLGFFKILSLFEPLLEWLGTLNAGQIAGLIFALMVAYSFMYGLLSGGPVVGAIYAGVAAAALGAIFAAAAFMADGGIVTSPTLAIIGERGPEAVIPLNQNTGDVNFGNNETAAQRETVWMLEENNKKLDRLIGAIETQNKIKRLSML